MKLFLILKQPQFFKQGVLLLVKIIFMVHNAVSLGGFLIMSYIHMKSLFQTMQKELKMSKVTPTILLI